MMRLSGFTSIVLVVLKLRNFNEINDLLGLFRTFPSRKKSQQNQ
jgi:hypothetical protein